MTSTPGQYEQTPSDVEQDSALADLQSPNHRELLDAIDKLRTQELDLPQLIVCGNQSSGKSSVLEAISHVKFPSSQGTTTRFASEFVLRRSPDRSVSVSIRPGPDTPIEVERVLRQFEPTINDPDEFPEILQQAAQCMSSASPHDRTFFSHMLHVEVSGPEQPHLTLVDLPGLIQSTNGPSAEEDIKLVEDLVRSYMTQSRSIILAVMSAQNDPETQPVFNMARRVDPRGSRTLGILTKPDLVEHGCEDALLRLARNETSYELELGWHVLKNRDNTTRNASCQERDAAEAGFFDDASSAWHRLPENSRSILTLRPKLSHILFQTITQSLPRLIQDLRRKRDGCARHLQLLGEPRPEQSQQRHFLIDISLKFNNIIAQAVDGNYDDIDFFDGSRVGSSGVKRFRNKLRELEAHFAQAMALHGQKFHITDEVDSHSCKTHNRTIRDRDVVFSQQMRQMCISTECARDAASRYIADNRGRELDGDAPPAAKAKIFKIQSSPWERVARDYVEQCLQVTQQFLRLALEHVAPAFTAMAILDHVAAETIECCTTHVAGKVTELVRPFQKFYPATRNPAYLKTRQFRMNGEVVDDPSDDGASVKDAPYIPSAEQVAADDILATIQSYYEIAEFTFIDNVIALGTEACIVEPLKAIFTAELISHMDPTLLSRIASEPDHVVDDRARNEAKLSLLQEVMRVCSKYSSSMPEHVVEPDEDDENADDQDEDSIVEAEEQSSHRHTGSNRFAQTAQNAASPGLQPRPFNGGLRPPTPPVTPLPNRATHTRSSATTQNAHHGPPPSGASSHRAPANSSPRVTGQGFTPRAAPATSSGGSPFSNQPQSRTSQSQSTANNGNPFSGFGNPIGPFGLASTTPSPLFGATGPSSSSGATLFGGANRSTAP